MTQRQIIADKLYDDEEVAAILGLPSANALNRARTRGDAPPYVRLTYRRKRTFGSTMLAWLKDREHASPAAELRPSRTSTRARARPFSAQLRRGWRASAPARADRLRLTTGAQSRRRDRNLRRAE